EKGQTYRLTPEQQAQILAMKHKSPRRTVQNIYHSLVCTGELCATKVSLATVQRFVRQQRKEQSWEAPEDRRTFEMPYANDMWEIDSAPGPYLYDAQGKNPKRLTIIAAIDDASRLIVGQGLFLADNALNVQQVLKQAIQRYGVPKKVFCDNGSPYRNKQLGIILAQLETHLIFARVRSGASKAKIERTFRTLKDDWMPAIDYKEFETLEAYNESLSEYNREKNQKIHRTLGKSPWQRFMEDQEHLRWKGKEAIERAFLHTGEYRVDKTGIVKMHHQEIEVGYRYIGQRVTLKYSPDLQSIYLYEDRELHPVQRVDKQANSRVKRKQIRLSGGESQ